MIEFGFEVGSTYENEKGVYEVLSMDKRSDTMVIKWENGEEATTAIDLQRRIIQRITYEREAAEAAKRPKRRKGPSGLGSKFDGLKEADFSEGIAGTTWRTQKGLGGAVTALLNADGLAINSRAVPRMPQVHWTDTQRQGPDDDRLEAKLFVRLDEDSLHYGFRMEGAEEAPQAGADWNNFIAWLSDGDHESWLKALVDEHDLRIYDMKDEGSLFDGQITVGAGSWRLADGDNAKAVESLSGFLKQLPDAASVDLQIEKTAGKEETIARGPEIAEDISGLFDLLMPLYSAATSYETP